MQKHSQIQRDKFCGEDQKRRKAKAAFQQLDAGKNCFGYVALGLANDGYGPGQKLPCTKRGPVQLKG